VPTDPRSTLLWIDRRQARFARAVIERAGLKVVAVGSPPESGQTDGAAGAFPDAELFSDIRQAVVASGASIGLLLTASPAEPGAEGSPADDPEFVGHCRHNGMRLFSTEPCPATTQQAAAEGAGDGVHILGLLRRSPVWLRAVDALENFGAIQTVSVAARCARDASTLGARLFDAMHLTHALLGLPESVDAAVAFHPTPGPSHVTPRSIRRLRGDLTANLRFGAHRAGAVTLSDRGGRWFRGVTLLGEAGCFRLDERGFEHIDPDGAVVDSSQASDDGPEDAAHAIATDLKRALDPHLPAPEPVDARTVLAICEAAQTEAADASS